VVDSNPAVDFHPVVDSHLAADSSLAVDSHLVVDSSLVVDSNPVAASHPENGKAKKGKVLTATRPAAGFPQAVVFPPVVVIRLAPSVVVPREVLAAVLVLRVVSVVRLPRGVGQQVFRRHRGLAPRPQ
jgi:hypothetical protein